MKITGNQNLGFGNLIVKIHDKKALDIEDRIRKIRDDNGGVLKCMVGSMQNDGYYKDVMEIGFDSSVSKEKELEIAEKIKEMGVSEVVYTPPGDEEEAKNVFIRMMKDQELDHMINLYR